MKARKNKIDPFKAIEKEENAKIIFKGKIVYDSSKPDGTPRKLLDVTRINKLGWKAKTDLKTGIQKTYQWYLEKSS